ncbi:CDP-diacylglycerol--glycerol-3-phosphate 3-phosphatidyltransferase [Novosphingobium sp. PC22D]|uniref:CDP-alcohol phosphatidyltransferase family protein n=1 Tax=Novosphingobium sp. PC22D TaxID=1962403 RepID=UPI000BF1DC8F|nr:CDP-alcohol phosphatidyltransferase family protein [Novosphingobium sp. PC22D]PEQ12803.1 CDP-diacylglycerol--glycerol-3-phosphate 3-phosphatidyltransferase [Novosphingobium sp. PC22D]
METIANRRPLTTRETRWAAAAARLLTRLGVSPNAISLAGIGFAAIGAAAFALSAQERWALAGAAIAIQLRLLANLFDGLVAVEGGKGSATGGLYNEFPDRIEDSLLLVAAGYACGWPGLGWVAALLAMTTAYLRALGGSLGFAQDFAGPMAKQHRMAALTLGAVLALVMPMRETLAATLIVVAAGSALTALRRLARLARRMRGQAR